MSARPRVDHAQRYNRSSVGGNTTERSTYIRTIRAYQVPGKNNKGKGVFSERSGQEPCENTIFDFTATSFFTVVGRRCYRRENDP